MTTEPPITISAPLPPFNGAAPSPSLDPNFTSPSPSPSVLTMDGSNVKAKGDIPNTPFMASIIAATLGGIVGASLLAAAIPLLDTLGLHNGTWGWGWARPQLGIYLVSLGLFHLSEFWVTAGWNPKKLSVDSFLLNNTVQYHIAHAVGLSEYFISCYFWPSKFETAWCGFTFLFPVTLFMFAAELFRVTAMIHASASFSHLVKAIKLDDHVLVTHGVYAYSRHPSYAGFFYWAIATQILLGNVFSTFAFVLVLGRFFSKRIVSEERFLVKFFGDDYVQYRKRVGTGLPFMISSA